MQVVKVFIKRSNLSEKKVNEFKNYPIRNNYYNNYLNHSYTVKVSNFRQDRTVTVTIPHRNRNRNRNNNRNRNRN